MPTESTYKTTVHVVALRTRFGSPAAERFDGRHRLLDCSRSSSMLFRPWRATRLNATHAPHHPRYGMCTRTCLDASLGAATTTNILDSAKIEIDRASPNQ